MIGPRPRGATYSIALSLAAFLAAAPARSAESADWQDVISPDRPGAANPPTVVGRGVFQLETAFESQRVEPHGAPSATTVDLPTLLRYGVGHDLELRLESNTFSREEGRSGFSDVSIEGKWCAIGGAAGSAFALAFLPSVTLPTGSVAFSAGKTQASLAALCGWTLESGASFALDGDAARVVESSGSDYQWRLDSQAAFQVPLRRNWAVSGDAFVSDLLVSGADAIWSADAAVEFYPHPDVQLDFVVIRTFTDPSAATSLQLGLSWRRKPPARH